MKPYVKTTFAVQLTILSERNKLCLLADEWIKKISYLYTLEYYSANKKMNSCHFEQHR